MAAASATSASTDHSRALRGAEWLQQLAAELVAVIKAEAAPEQPQEPYDESPGDGWRWLEPGEVIEDHDMVKGASKFFPNIAPVVGCKVAPDQHKTYRRRI